MSTQDTIQREILPIPDIPPIGLTTYDAKDPETKYPPITPLRPPEGAPNVLIILIDDCASFTSARQTCLASTPMGVWLKTRSH